MRASLEGWGDHTAEPRGVDFREDVVGGVPAIWAVPHACALTGVVVCCHGGGYSAGSMHSHRKLYGHVAKAIGCRALVVGYRRVPEHPYPAALDDVVAVHRGLLEAGAAPGRVALAGDSAGGALAVSAAIRGRDLGLPAAATIALSPWVDLEATGPSYALNAGRDHVNSRALVLAMAAAVVERCGDPPHPLLSPQSAPLAGAPPLYVQVGGAETLLDDARALAASARAAGVEVELDVVDDMQHCFQMLAGNAPQADAAIARLGRWTARRMDLP